MESEAIEALRVRKNGSNPVETRNYDQPFSPLSGYGYGAGYRAKDEYRCEIIGDPCASACG